MKTWRGPGGRGGGTSCSSSASAATSIDREFDEVDTEGDGEEESGSSSASISKRWMRRLRIRRERGLGLARGLEELRVARAEWSDVARRSSGSFSTKLSEDEEAGEAEEEDMRLMTGGVGDLRRMRGILKRKG